MPRAQRAGRAGRVGVAACAGSLALLLAAAGGPLAAGPLTCGRVVAVGDLHGAYEPFVSILRETGLLDGEMRWSGGEACLVQLGDVVDRGAESRRILDLLISLERQASGRVLPLMGNHEVMDVLGDLRSVDPGEFAAFAAEEDPADRAAGLRAFRSCAPADRDAATLEQEFAWRFPPGWFAHRRAFSPSGAYGAWLEGHPALTVIDGTLFVHGGIDLADARLGVAKLDAQVTRDLETFHETRRRLVEAGWIDPLDPLATAWTAVDARLAQEAAPVDDLSSTARSWLGTLTGILMRPDGPLWNRDFALGDENDLARTVPRVLELLGVERIVVAHTPTEDHRIHSRLDGRVFLIDTGAAEIYGGRISALELDRDGSARAVYLGESEPLSGPTAPAPPVDEAAGAEEPAGAAGRRSNR